MRNETIRDTTGQNVLEATVRNRRLGWFDHVYNAWKTPEEVRRCCIGSVTRRESDVDHALLGETHSEKISNVRQHHRMISVSRQPVFENTYFTFFYISKKHDFLRFFDRSFKKT